jgi:hypothetical protein
VDQKLYDIYKKVKPIPRQNKVSTDLYAVRFLADRRHRRRRKFRLDDGDCWHCF